MSYRVTRGADRRPAIHLTDEPPYCRALDAAPSAREPELDRDSWLVMVFAAWSAPDIAAVQTALDVAKRYGGRFQLGLRPFDDPQEHSVWCRDIENDEATPLWLLLRDGRVRRKHTGPATADAIAEMIDAAGSV